MRRLRAQALLPLLLYTMEQKQLIILWNGCKLPLTLPKTFEKENWLPSQFLDKQYNNPELN